MTDTGRVEGGRNEYLGGQRKQEDVFELNVLSARVDMWVLDYSKEEKESEV